jgi:DNA-binding CsgD family transcriptional regulator
MNSINREMTAMVKKSLKLLEKTIEKEPLILIDAKGKYWFNDVAQEFISNNKIPKEDFVEWLRIGSLHLQNLRYGDIGIHMMELPGKKVIAFLKYEQGKTVFEKAKLTRREKEILRYLVKGASNRKIADLLKISPGTVNAHLDSIYSKLGCSNRVAACHMALKGGLFLPIREV